MLDIMKEIAAYLLDINNLMGIFEPLYDSKKEVTKYKIKFSNEAFEKEFYNQKVYKENIIEMNWNLKEYLMNCAVKLNSEYITIVDSVYINGRDYKVQCHKLKEGFLLCTFYRNENILINQEETSSYQDVFENLMDIILVVSESGAILYGNKKAVDTYGYSYDELVNLNIFELRNQDGKDYTRKQLNEALKKGITFKTYHYKKDGSKILVEVRSIYSEELKDRVVSIIRDISTLEKITKDAAMFSVSLDICDDTIIALTKDFRISLWSKGAEKKLGYKKEEIMGKSIKLLIPNNRLNEFEYEINMVLQGNIIENFETVRMHKNGDSIDISLSISPLYDCDGILIGAIGIYKDISEKKKLAQKLKEYEIRSRMALEGGQFGIWELNIANQELIHFNKWQNLLGYNEDEIHNSPSAWKDLIHPEDAANVMEEFHKYLKEEKELIIEYRIKCKNNQYKWIRTKGKIYERDLEGRPLKVVGTNEDITDRKIIEQKLKEKCRQLEGLKQTAESANRAKTQFLANMSHEIRTPMNGVVATIQLLRSTNLDLEQSQYIEMLNESAEVLVAIINDILDVSKIEVGTIQVNTEPFNLKETISSVYNNLLVMGNAKGLEVGYYLDPKLDLQVVGDELKVKQILNNLISNAVKFTDKGYISFRTTQISSGHDFIKIEVKVRDSGIGIEDSFKEEIFYDFSQGDLSSKKKYSGTGLGLAISKQLAQLMGGNIWFESTIGEGSTFYFSCRFKKSNLKEDTESNEDKKIKDIEYTYSNQEKCILCVEDNIINQKVLESIITREGYTYLAAHDGKEALDILKNTRVDLILMDIQLPELNGFETTKIIHRDFEKRIPIIAMTAYAMHEDRDKCMEWGMDDYIPKPFDLENLYKILKHYLGKS